MKTNKFKTTSAYLTGGICGKIWMPSAMAGIPVRENLRGAFGFFGKGDTFREALNSLLCRKGGDFQNAAFTVDTVLRIERRAVTGVGRYAVHVREIALASLCGCKELVNEECFVADFMGEDF